jgi:DNA polymerase-3 subunit delta'
MEYENNREAIKIGDMREIISRCNMSTPSAYKIVILQSIGRMTPEAANAFLKTLEEPPPRTVFIMTTSHIRDLLPTIVSRTRVLKFHLFSTQLLEEKMKELHPDIEALVLQNIAKLSLGRAGRAIDLINQPDMLAYFMKLYKDILYILDTTNVVERFSYVEDLVDDEKMRRDFLGVMSHVLRSKILEPNSSEIKGKAIEMVAKVQEAGILLRQNVNTRLVLENLMLT